MQPTCRWLPQAPHSVDSFGSVAKAWGVGAEARAGGVLLTPGMVSFRLKMQCDEDKIQSGRELGAASMRLACGSGIGTEPSLWASSCGLVSQAEGTPWRGGRGPGRQEGVRAGQRVEDAVHVQEYHLHRVGAAARIGRRGGGVWGWAGGHHKQTCRASKLRRQREGERGWENCTKWHACCKPC